MHLILRSLYVSNIYNHVGEILSVSGVTSDTYSGYNTLYRISGVSTSNQVNVTSSREIVGFGTDLTSQASSSQAILSGKTLGISTFTYYAQSGIGTLTFTSAHGLRKNGKVRIAGADQSLFNNDFVVSKVNSTTSVDINIGVTTTAPSTGGSITVYVPSLTSYGGNIEKETEASSGRLLTQYAGISTTLGQQILDF